MSSDAMNFPDGWWRFVQQYQFADKEEIYTNGSMLIPSFRVRQMVEHYFGGEVGKTSRYSELFGTPERAARTLEEIKCDNDICEFCPMFEACDNCLDVPLLEWLRGDAE